VTGVPTFVVQGRGVVGAQPYEILERLVVLAGAQQRDVPAT
jgi:predicted DsbA family dithiol-disulfide isomerase